MKPLHFLAIVSALLASFFQTSLYSQTNNNQSVSLSDLIPADKKLNPGWVKSLTERGEQQVCKGPELAHIGMPIGGLFAGQLYIGGDGQLWHWDVFNDFLFTGWAGNYHPRPVTKPLEQSFNLIIDGREIPFSTNGFSDITFRGEYPMAFVTYRDPSVPVSVGLTAFSPFIPLNVDDSSLPLTVMEYSLTNISLDPVTVTLKGSLENFALARERGALNGTRVNRVVSQGDLTLLEESMGPEPQIPSTEDRLLVDWVKSGFNGWAKEVALTPSPDPKNPASFTSPPFTIDSKHLYAWMLPWGRTGHEGGLDLLVDGKVVASLRPIPSHSDIRGLHLQALDLTQWAGKEGRLRADAPPLPDKKIPSAFGSIFLSDREILHNPKMATQASRADAEDNGSMALALLDGPADLSSGNQEAPASGKLVGAIGRTVSLQPGECRRLRFVLAWYFPNLLHIPRIKEQGRWYASKFSSAGDVVRYLAGHWDQLTGDTRLWHDTWYDSTLPWWFLDRTMVSIDNLATSSNYRFKNGRWWAWEGVGSCEGTCGHVYGYAQAVARLFPEIERDQRERIDFGSSLSSEGWIDCRGENGGKAAIDAQAMYILRALREHQMTTDNTFLSRIWLGVKKAMEYMIKQDPGEKGVIVGGQHNTLDSDWYGEVSWYNSLYLAALTASAQMADLMKVPETATRFRRIAKAGKEYQTKHLFNGEYFQNKIDPAHLNTINSGSGCEIDQVLGQSWAFQVGLPRVLPKQETVSSLQSLWKYNFAPDVGPFKAVFRKGRNYAERGEAGLLMCTFPRPDWDLKKASGNGNEMYASYFNECMNGFEHQVAGHMIWEGEAEGDLVTKGLAIERAIHDRYAPSKRNPYNEVECGDHYGRSMASYGVFLAACGFDYDGPKGHIGFAPRIHPENFKAAFTAAEGWGSYSQKITDNTFTSELTVKWGQVALRSFSLATSEKPSSIKVTVGGVNIPSTFEFKDGKTTLLFKDQIVVKEGEALTLVLNLSK